MPFSSYSAWPSRVTLASVSACAVCARRTASSRPWFERWFSCTRSSSSATRCSMLAHTARSSSLSAALGAAAAAGAEAAPPSSAAAAAAAAAAAEDSSAASAGALAAALVLRWISGSSSGWPRRKYWCWNCEIAALVTSFRKRYMLSWRTNDA